MSTVYGKPYIRKKREHPAKIIIRPARKRRFESADQNRLTADWKLGSENINQLIRSSLTTLRTRSRDLWQNDDYVKSFGRRLKSNVVGSQGITLQNRATRGKRLDEETNSRIEKAFEEWSKPKNCTVTGQLSRQDFETYLIETVARDGEALIKKVVGFDNEFGFALQYIPAEMLDVRLNKKLRNGNEVINGVEYNTYFRPVFYWIKKSRSEYANSHERVNADSIQHLFSRDLGMDQSRGVPWTHTAILRLRNLGAYEEAAIVASRVGASGMGFIATNDDPDTRYQGDEEYDDGAYLDEVAPGEWIDLPPGKKPYTYNPAYPQINHGDFMKAVLRGVSSGLGINYNSMTGDLEGVNYSSIRQGVLDDRDVYKLITKWLTTHHNSDYYNQWLSMAIMNGKINLPLGLIEKFSSDTWVGRGRS